LEIFACGRLSLQTMYIKRKSSAIAAASAAATTAENTAVTTPEAMVDQTFYGNNTRKGAKSQGFSKENTADLEKVRKSAEETTEKVHEKNRAWYHALFWYSISFATEMNTGHKTIAASQTLIRLLLLRSRNRARDR
ncbi:MAG: hypothetical protein IKW79_03290, partial [Schwartzia sp.]|nr:hypothetical protein [Schwartzia sp. (in: firmicutes)]